ncbi:MAG: hypothetical protein ACTSRG_15530 [Candidatus Helarchaeota archaeon]
MPYQEIIQAVLLGIILSFVILLILITRNILQHRHIYNFRTDDTMWDHWKSQVFGLILFVVGFISFTVLFFGYIYVSHPELFGLGLTLNILIQDPLQYFIYVLNSFLGLIVAILGMILSNQSMGKFIKNIEDSKKEGV